MSRVKTKTTRPEVEMKADLVITDWRRIVVKALEKAAEEGPAAPSTRLNDDAESRRTADKESP